MLVLSFAYAIGRALCRASIHAEFSILAIACSGCQRLCYIAGPEVGFPLRSQHRQQPHSVSSPRFPHLWKTLWKSRSSGWAAVEKRHFWPESAGRTRLTRAVCHTLVISPLESGRPRLVAPE